MIGLLMLIAAQAATPELRAEVTRTPGPEFTAEIAPMVLRDARSRDRFAAGEPEHASQSTDSETAPR